MTTPTDIVDAQLHLTLEMDEHRLLASMDRLGIRGAVLDEFWYRTDTAQFMPCVPLPGGAFRPLSPYVQAAVVRNPDRFRFLQRVEMADPRRQSVAALLADHPGCRAVRVMLFTAEDRRQFTKGDYDGVLAVAQGRSMPLCLFGADPQVLRSTKERFPGLRIVLDHCGGARGPEDWESVLGAATFPGVYLKWCHPHRVFGHDGARMQREFLRAVEAFGAERVMWASDITMEDSGVDWAELLGFVHDNPALSDDNKQWVLGRSARTVFAWTDGSMESLSSPRLTEVEQ
ncbi:amidohydrolase family protein [Amycolatopsis pithecellobii]|uniref:Amidohydrolase family protein n=1 Tax=Amycolatopsis pithecellobii TaxID=664692 RepID=A0A6N7YX35_9PSEU|nr:amidohydrolase family protein [Amycolatopsis pithecellobii]MTD56492.1 amidohydrolase family protein [Amycolatopsis pithecellobii]